MEKKEGLAKRIGEEKRRAEAKHKKELVEFAEKTAVKEQNEKLKSVKLKKTKRRRTPHNTLFPIFLPNRPINRQKFFPIHQGFAQIFNNFKNNFSTKLANRHYEVLP